MGATAVRQDVRIDHVQHNISALVNLWFMTTQGDIPQHTPNQHLTGLWT